MGGFGRVLGRLTMAAFAFSLAIGLPNVGQAQTPQTEKQAPSARLPWQTASFQPKPASFDKDWARVLSDMQQMLRRFAASYPYHEVLKVDVAAQTDLASPLWVANVPIYVPPAKEPLRVDVGAFRVTGTPVEFTSGVAAESRTMEGVLVGMQVEVVD